MNEATIEAEIQAKGLTAPRITPTDVDACIDSEHYFTALDGVDGYYRGGPEAQAVRNAPALKLLTFCVLVLRNGFTVTGESACASPENFDAELGRKIAFQNAREKIWALEGYRLRSELAAACKPAEEPAPTHASDCSLHNGPAEVPRPCDCGAEPGRTPEDYGSEFPKPEVSHD